MTKDHIFRIISVVFILLIYTVTSEIVDKEIVLPKVLSIYRYFTTLPMKVLFENIISTFFKASMGFFISLVIGLLLALLSSYKNLYQWIEPYISILKSLPTISIIIIALIFLGKEKSIYMIAILVILPIFFEIFSNNIRHVDEDLKEVTIVYQFNTFKKLKFLYFYHILEDLFLSLKQTFGLCFKLIVMAEVFAQSHLGIGAQIQNERINVNSDGIFFWTFLLILFVLLVDSFIEYTSKKVLKWRT